MSKSKIAIIISHPIQHFCPQYVSYAKSIEWNVKVFFASTLGLHAYTDKSFGQTIAWNNLDMDKFPHVFLNNNKNIPVNSKLDAPELEMELMNYNPDVVIVNGYFQKYQRRAYTWAKKHKKKIFYISDSENRHERNILLVVIKSFFLKNYFKHIDAFLTVGDANEEYYKYYGAYPAKLFRTCFPIDLNLYEQSFLNKEAISSSFRLKNNIPKDEIVCSVVGKLIKHKNQVQIIDALKKIDTPMTLLIIGSGPDFDFLKSKAEVIKNHRIIFPGFVNPIELPNYYAATDIYIHPALIEPHSLAISEAIYMGCPVIISNTCGSYGSTDDIQPGKNGFVYEWNNIDQLVNLMIKLASDENLRKHFGEYSRNLALNLQANAHGKGLKAALINTFINEN